MKFYLSLACVFFCLILDVQAQVLSVIDSTEINQSRLIKQSNSLSVPCNVTNVGLLTTSKDSVCPADSFILDLLFTSGFGTGMIFQLESSLNGINFSSVPNANYYPFIIQNQFKTTYYRMKVDCPTSGIIFTTPVVVYQKPLASCYCIPLHPPCDSNYITNVTFNTLNNSSSCSNNLANSYTLFPHTGFSTGTYIKGFSYPLSITNGSGNTRFYCWIDYNQDGVFSVQEWTIIAVNALPFTTVTGTMVIPIGCASGQTRLRVRADAIDTSNISNPACDYFFSGETEDYDISIVGFGPTSLVETSHSSSVIVYPNPATDVLYFKAENTIPSKISIYDILGHLYLTCEYKDELSISVLGLGSYFIKFDFESNCTPVFKKFIIAR